MFTIMNKAATTTEFARVCEAIPRLTPAEREQVKLRLGFLGGGETTTAVYRDERDWLLRGLEDELRRRGVIGAGRLHVDRIVPGWGKTSEAVRADLVRALGGKSNPRELAAFGRLVARCLTDYLEGGGVPVGPKTVLINAGKALVAVDAQFPGYAGAGLLRCVLNPGMLGK